MPLADGIGSLGSKNVLNDIRQAAAAAQKNFHLPHGHEQHPSLQQQHQQQLHQQQLHEQQLHEQHLHQQQLLQQQQQHLNELDPYRPKPKVTVDVCYFIGEDIHHSHVKCDPQWNANAPGVIKDSVAINNYLYNMTVAANKLLSKVQYLFFG